MSDGFHKQKDPDKRFIHVQGSFDKRSKFLSPPFLLKLNKASYGFSLVTAVQMPNSEQKVNAAEVNYRPERTHHLSDWHQTLCTLNHNPFCKLYAALAGSYPKGMRREMNN
jgi:hypothetical protein